jgi:Arc/MetJ family transcription regulator
MPFISIDDELYAAASRRAGELGFPSVEAYVEDLLLRELGEPTAEQLRRDFEDER